MPNFVELARSYFRLPVVIIFLFLFFFSPLLFWLVTLSYVLPLLVC